MTCSADDAPAYVATACARYATTFSSSGLSSASSGSSFASTSLWSDDDGCLSATSSDSDSCPPRPIPDPTPVAIHPPPALRDVEPVPLELRQNPRRTASAPHGRGLAAPPALVRQSDRRINFVDSLVDSSTRIVEAIWPSSVVCRSEPGSKAVLPLRTFIQETLRRSRTSYSTLQVALYYLVLVKARVPKHALTAEQLDDRPADHRALQCGRRMFLAALILASKYLQDRNYSARAWSKISGLNTHEINQNEIAFLLAVNWKLHIADDVFQRWTDMVLKCMPPPSPPPPSADDATTAMGRHQPADWKRLILRLDPDLINVEDLLRGARTSIPAKTSDLSVLSPRSILNMPLSQDPTSPAGIAASSYSAAPTPSMPTCRPASIVGPLPTPRLTPSTGGLCTPAAGALSQVLGRGSGSMGMAMAQAGCIGAAQGLDRLPCSNTSSPQGYHHLSRRSSLANSVSTASSPESMVSDVSSRSSTSSLVSAMHQGSLPSRFRVSRVMERACGRPSVPTVLEDHDEYRLTSSPEAYAYTAPVGKPGGLYMDTPLARRELELEAMARDAASDAARALQDLHNHGRPSAAMHPARMVNRSVSLGKRDRAASAGDGPLQDNVRDMLAGRRRPPDTPWPKSMVYSRNDVSLQFAVRPAPGGPGKRVCCSAEAASMHPALGLVRGPGMWNDILN
ncbi:hypothetical protein XA68_17248 [Ophiocordyceps unilateralis]|uniref:Cyclin N-terminal domain-containing protein n=1 Tax=Ophiocordyceps unilateralis TaxID=268505 RepID=A0A2A9P3H3_OPHUN|nr:hypothetical protein XA68_17248 [Ophiocordyceps unilateralis]